MRLTQVQVVDESDGAEDGNLTVVSSDYQNVQVGDKIKPLGVTGEPIFDNFLVVVEKTWHEERTADTMTTLFVTLVCYDVDDVLPTIMSASRADVIPLEAKR